jgi:prepilin-type processing-associated H-X9-DG protein
MYSGRQRRLSLHRLTADARFIDARFVRTQATTRFGGAHLGGFNAAMCDGSVQPIAYDIDEVVYRALGSRAAGDSVGAN